MRVTDFLSGIFGVVMFVMEKKLNYNPEITLV